MGRAKTITAKNVFVFGVFLSVFSRIWTEFGDLLPKSSYSVRMGKNTDQIKSEYRHLSRNAYNFAKYVRSTKNLKIYRDI